MKKQITFVLIALLCSISAMALGKKTTIDRTELPLVSQEFLMANFNQTKVSTVKMKKNLLKKETYEVKLINKVEIDFANDGDWTEVDCKKGAVPSAIIPDPIKSYVKQHYSGAKIVKIKRDGGDYKVKLNDKTELQFDSHGKCTRMKAH